MWGRAASAIVAALTVVGLWGCSEDPAGPQAGDLFGFWGAVQHEHTSLADPDLTYDLIADGGGTYSLELLRDGTYRWTLNSPQGNTTGTGSFAVAAGKLTLTPESGGEPTVYSATLGDIFLTLRNEDAAWDFDGDGAPEPAELIMLLDRF